MNHPTKTTVFNRNVSDEESNPWATRQALEQLAALGYINLPESDKPQEAIDNTRRDRLNNLAQVHLSAGRLAETLEILQSLLAEKDDPHLRCRISLCLVGLKKIDEADALMSGISDDARKCPLVRLILGEIKLAQNRID